MAYEATYGWRWFADLLANLGIPAHMAHPRANKAIANARVKNDAVYAKTLAQLLRQGRLAHGLRQSGANFECRIQGARAIFFENRQPQSLAQLAPSSQDDARQ